MTEDGDEAVAEENRIRTVYAQRRTAIAKGRYSLLHPSNLYRVQQAERELVRELRRDERTPLSECRVLDIGCGAGFWLREFAKLGAAPGNLHGIDLLPDRIESARELSPSGMTFTTGSASDLHYPDASFDLVTQFTVFTSVLDQGLRQRIASEMLRVLKPNGRILWFDFHYDNPSNREVRGVRKGEIPKLFPGCAIRFTRVGLAPPLGNLLGGSAILYELLCEIPWLCTHHIASIAPLARSGLTSHTS